jgi:tRNA1(Val) A37 N6-methylase TrmN6
MNTPNKDYQLLGGRLDMRSADAGYRAAIDPVLLAASLPALSGERVLDIGCGTGAAALCLATRIPDVHVVGIDLQAPLIALAREIAELNELDTRAQFQCCDLLDPPGQLAPASFDHVMANPPHHKKHSGNPSPDPLKAAANVEGDAALADWVSFCFSRVKAGGTVTFVHRYDRKDELALLLEQGGAVTVFPLWPKVEGTGAKRVLVQAVKGVDGGTKMQAGLVLHASENDYTPEAHAVLREASALKL